MRIGVQKMNEQTIEDLQKINRSLELEAKEAKLFGNKDCWTLANRHIKLINELIEKINNA